MTQWRFRRGIEMQTKAFLDGFNVIVPVNWPQFFDEKELELMLCGMQELDVDEWEKYTTYKGYDKESKQIKWLWQVIAIQTFLYMLCCTSNSLKLHTKCARACMYACT